MRVLVLQFDRDVCGHRHVCSAKIRPACCAPWLTSMSYTNKCTQISSDPLVRADKLFTTNYFFGVSCRVNFILRCAGWSNSGTLILGDSMPDTVQMRRRCRLCSYHAFRSFQCCLLIVFFLPCGITMFAKTYFLFLFGVGYNQAQYATVRLNLATVPLMFRSYMCY